MTQSTPSNADALHKSPASDITSTTKEVPVSSPAQQLPSTEPTTSRWDWGFIPWRSSGQQRGQETFIAGPLHGGTVHLVDPTSTSHGPAVSTIVNNHFIPNSSGPSSSTTSTVKTYPNVTHYNPGQPNGSSTFTTGALPTSTAPTHSNRPTSIPSPGNVMAPSFNPSTTSLHVPPPSIATPPHYISTEPPGAYAPDAWIHTLGTPYASTHYSGVKPPV